MNELVFVDLNNDGKDDLLVTDRNNLYILFGGDAFTGRHDATVDSESADAIYASWGSSLGAGDVNQDGRDDLFSGSGNTNRVYFAKSPQMFQKKGLTYTPFLHIIPRV